MFQVGNELGKRNVLALRRKDRIIGPKPNGQQAYSRNVRLFFFFGKDLQPLTLIIQFAVFDTLIKKISSTDLFKYWNRPLSIESG